MPLPRRFLLAFLLLVTAVSAHAQAYTSIVVLGDSLSDTGNDTHVSTAAYTAAAAVPAPATGYTQGSFTDGSDTSPAARLYTGVWIKQLAALLPARPAVVDSLDGGTNYAYGFAFTGSGTSTLSYGPGNIFSFPVNNMGLQLSTYLGTSPTITSKTLFVIWGGANDLLNATSTAAVTTAAANELGILQTLISAGATDFLIVDLPPLGAIPRLMGTGSTATSLTAASALFNQTLAAGLTALPAANPGKTLHLYPLDVFSLFNAILAAPSSYGFTDVVDMSQYTPVNPDTYLFWDGLHPTTAGHHLIATAALSLLSPATTTTTVTSSALSASLGTSVTFIATVASTGGIPPGVVTFYDGATAVGNGQLSGTSPDTATFTTSSLTAGTHSITAVYTATQYFNASTSAALSEMVVAPALAVSANPMSLTVKTGASTTTSITLNAVGGLTGLPSLTCGSLPAHISCSFNAVTNLTLANPTVSSTLTLSTNASSRLLTPRRPGDRWSPLETVAMCALIPLFGIATVRRRRMGRPLPGLPGLALLLALTGMSLGLGGCSGNKDAVSGTYSVPVNVAVGSTTATLTLSLTVTP